MENSSFNMLSLSNIGDMLMGWLIVFFLFSAIIVITLFLFFTLRSVIKGAPFVITTNRYVNEIIKLSDIKKKDIMCDMGSGDGRIVIAFARRGIEAHGIEHNPFLVFYSRFLIRRAKLSGKAFIHWGNLWDKNYSQYNIITLFGISYIMNGLEKKLQKELKPGAKVISLGFKFPNWKIEKNEEGLYMYIR